MGTYLELTDTPGSYSGKGSQVVAVKGAEDGLEFVEAGAQGPQGPQGYMGEQGVIGEGVQGDQGPEGSQGEQGQQGWMGVQGPPGGEQGDQGPQGPNEFVDLIDTPASYSGQQGKVVAVKGTQNGVEFTDSPTFKNISGNRFLQVASGIPTSNLGSPTVTEMALFDPQFNNKTAFYNINNLKFYTYDGEWTEYTAFSDTNKRRFLGGDVNSGINIPNLTEKFRIEITSAGYVYLNALYMYWSSNSHNTTVHIWRRYYPTQVWSQLTSSTATVSAWPGHMYLPFPTIPFHPTGPSHYDAIRIEFTPNWSGHPEYGDNPISLYRLQLWGGYPAGKRRIYSIDEYKKVTFPDDLKLPAGKKLYFGSNYLDNLIANNEVPDSERWKGHQLPTLSAGKYLYTDDGANLSWETGGQGPQGDQGPQGYQGNTGAQGAEGDQGDQGFQGVKGDQGDEGAQGAQGFQGDIGAQGATGAQGAVGAQGEVGDQGDTGSQGFQGFQGDEGAQGATGDQGDTGAQGSTGSQGVKGDEGDTGPQGSTGSQGVRGYQGYQGTPGSTGSQGPRGYQGYQGNTGSQGPRGYQGYQGYQGDPATDADTVDGYHASIATAANTCAVRDGSGDVKARLFRSEYDTTNATCNIIYTAIDTASNNYLRPSTKAQLIASLNLMTKAGGTFTGHVYARDHGAAATDMLTNICYGTGSPPTANTTTIGTLYIKYTP